MNILKKCLEFIRVGFGRLVLFISVIFFLNGQRYNDKRFLIDKLTSAMI